MRQGGGRGARAPPATRRGTLTVPSERARVATVGRRDARRKGGRGEWRVGDFDGTHFVVSHRESQPSWHPKTAMIYRKDGTQHPGPRSQFGGCAPQTLLHSWVSVSDLSTEGG